jgi:hypothetical protein
MTRHGEPEPVSLERLLDADPGLALVTADLSAWRAAHPCTCDDDADTCRCLDPDDGS